MTEWYPTLQLRWARRSTSRMAVLQQQFFNGRDYEWRDVPSIVEEEPTEKMTVARKIAEEAVMLLRINNMSSHDIEIAVQKLDLMIERAIHDEIKRLVPEEQTRPDHGIDDRPLGDFGPVKWR